MAAMAGSVGLVVAVLGSAGVGVSVVLVVAAMGVAEVSGVDVALSLMEAAVAWEETSGAAASALLCSSLLCLPALRVSIATVWAVKCADSRSIRIYEGLPIRLR